MVGTKARDFARERASARNEIISDTVEIHSVFMVVLCFGLRPRSSWVAPTLLSMSASQGADIQGNVCATPAHFHGFWVRVSGRA